MEGTGFGDSVWRTMLDSTVDAILVIDSRGIVLAANKATENMFGYRLSDVIGHNVKMLMTDADKDRHDQYIQRYLASGSPRVIGIGREVVGQHRTGHQIDLDLAVTETTLGDQHVFVGILRDITERRVMQRAHSQFVANVSHEIRTPMNAVVGVTRLLKETQLTAEQREMIETIEHSSESLLTIINDILDFSRLESKKLVLESIPVNLRECVEQALDLVAFGSKNDTVEIAYFLDDSVPTTVYTDPVRLRQIIINVVTNGVKFSPSGGSVVVKVTAKPLARRATASDATAAPQRTPPTPSQPTSRPLPNPHGSVVPGGAGRGASAFRPAPSSGGGGMGGGSFGGGCPVIHRGPRAGIMPSAAPMSHPPAVPAPAAPPKAVSPTAGHAAPSPSPVAAPVATHAAPGSTPAASDTSSASEYMIQFEVVDTGIGIARDRLPTLFRAFGQLDSSGLGLVICRLLTEMMGGEIAIDSEGLGRGTTCCFNIVAPVVHENPGQSTLNIAPQRLAMLRDKQVLVVDPSSLGAAVLKQFVGRYGVHVMPVSSGEQALQLLSLVRENAIHAVFISTTIKDRSASALVAQLSEAAPWLPHHAFVAMMPISQRESRVQDVFAYTLSKPLKFANVVTLLCDIVDPSSATAQTVPGDVHAHGEVDPSHAPSALRILVAEDNIVNQKVISWMLSRLGYQADIVSNGEEALRACEQQAYDVVLMDVHMPIMDGLQATRELRARFATSDDPGPYVVALTASAMAGDSDRCLASGMDMYLVKPIDMQQLKDTLLHCASTRRSEPRNDPTGRQRGPPAVYGFDPRSVPGMVAGAYGTAAGDGAGAGAADGAGASVSGAAAGAVPGGVGGAGATGGTGDGEVGGGAGMAGGETGAVGGVDDGSGDDGGQPPLDEHALEMVREMGLMGTLVDTYFASVPLTLQQLRSALASGDLSAAAVSCHTARGANGSVGALRLATLLKNLEIGCNERLPPSELSARYAEVDREYRRVAHALRQLSKQAPRK